MSKTHLASWRKCVGFRVLCHINLVICCDIIPYLELYLEYLIILIQQSCNRLTSNKTKITHPFHFE